MNNLETAVKLWFEMQPIYDLGAHKHKTPRTTQYLENNQKKMY